MEISPFLLAQLLFFSFVFGIFLGVVNDLNRIIRAFFGQKYSNRNFEKLYSFFKLEREALYKLDNTPRKDIGTNILIFFQDLMFMIISAFGIIMLNYDLNDGKFRLFSVLAVICGFILYFFTIGKLVIAISEPIVIIFKACFKKIMQIVFAPVKFVFNIVLKFARKILLSIKKELEKRENMRYNKIRSREVTDLADNGFLP